MRAGNEKLPHAGLRPKFHGVDAWRPVIEIADHRDRLCIRRPHGEVGPAFHKVRAQFLEAAVVRPFGKKVADRSPSGLLQKL